MQCLVARKLQFEAPKKGEETMRKSSIALLAAIVATGALALGAGTAGATSGAHFFSATASVADNGALSVVWDEAGVGQQQVNYTLSASASATYACINGGGNHPKASNKETVQGSVGATGTFNPTNGRVHGSFTAGPLSQGSFTCPSGQTLVLACVSYTDIVLTDTTNGVTADIADTSRTFVNVAGC
jgi:hypothetical protein